MYYIVRMCTCADNNIEFSSDVRQYQVVCSQLGDVTTDAWGWVVHGTCCSHHASCAWLPGAWLYMGVLRHHDQLHPYRARQGCWLG